MERVGDLEIDQDVRFQEREWKAERVGWALLAAVVVLALAGLFGDGPLSWSTARAGDGSLVVDYERFGRRGGSQEVVVAAPAATAEGGRWELDVSSGYLGAFTVDAVSPQPESVEPVGDGVRYTFAQAEPGADLEVVLAVTPQALWRQSGTLRLAGRDAVDVSQFFFP